MITMSRELAMFDQASRMLAEAQSLQDIKSIRDKAEAARNYVKAAKLGLQLQNRAAELKLSAERKAGKVLRSLRLRGGNRSKRHNAPLKLADMGISRDQSKRWQHIASVSEAEFAGYIERMNTEEREITSAGLLRIAAKCRPISDLQTTPHSPVQQPGDGTKGFALETLEELNNHFRLLANILRPFCDESGTVLQRGEKRIIHRLITEITDLVEQMKANLTKVSGSEKN